MNEAIRVIFATDMGLGQNKTGQLFKDLELSGNVESAGQLTHRLPGDLILYYILV